MRANLARIARHLALPSAALGLWQLSVSRGWIDGRLFPAPAAILHEMIAMARMGMLWDNIGGSLARVTVGFGAGLVAAVALAALFARWQGAAELGAPVIELLRPISVIAWIPIAVIWFGLGDRPAWFIIFLGAFFPIFTNALAGFMSVDPAHVDAARSLGAGRWLFLREVLWPTALPHLLTGVRIGAGTAWTAVIAAEMISGQSGLGYMIQMARMMVEPERVLAGMILIGLIGYTMNASISYLETRLVPWREDNAQ